MLAALVVLTVLASATTAWAAFNDSTTASATYTSDTLSPPADLSAAAGTCTLGTSDRIVLSWKVTTSSWATGYEVARSTTAGGPYTVIATVSGVATVTYTNGPLAFSTTYYYAVRSMKSSWRSTDATASRTTRNTVCL